MPGLALWDLESLAFPIDVVESQFGDLVRAQSVSHQQKKNGVEEIFGWMKTVGGLRKLRHRGLESVGWMLTFTAAAYSQ
jgi:hypothetical protein